jgi:GntR family transcriptional regulator
MIAFRLVGRSNVPVYAQLVQQVKQALRLGRLEPGERLPTVREVAEALAINPHTVLKAYRELELEGLVEGRAGLGTFVRQAAPGRPLAQQATLHRELVAWLGRARAAGWERDDVIALVDTTLRAAYDDGADREGIA